MSNVLLVVCRVLLIYGIGCLVEIGGRLIS